MEQIGLGDKIVEIGSQQLKDSVCFLLPFIKETVVYQLSKRCYQLPKGAFFVWHWIHIFGIVKICKIKSK